MNVLSRDTQIQIIAALTEGMSIRAVERLTGVHRDTIMRLGVRVGAGCAALHDRTVHSLHVGRLELDQICNTSDASKRTSPAKTWPCGAINTPSLPSPRRPARSSPTGPANAIVTTRMSLRMTCA